MVRLSSKSRGDNMGNATKRKKNLQKKNRNKKILELKKAAWRKELRDKILTWEAKELKEPAEAVESLEYNLNTAEVLEQVLDTTENGVGIAATQIGNMSRVFITRPNFPKDNKTFVFINPEITSYGSEKVTEKEGCLSYPDYYCEVERSDEITISYTDKKGKQQTETFTGWHSRVIQHEYDHLQGVCEVSRSFEALPLHEQKKLKFKKG